MPNEVLYCRIDSALKRELQRLASESGLSIREVTEMVIAKGLGMDSSASVNRVKALIDERFGTERDRKHS